MRTSGCRASARPTRPAGGRWPSSRCARPLAEAPCEQARSRALQRALVVDAQRRVRNGLEPLLADRAAAGRAESVRPVLDPPERRLDLDRECARRSPRAPRRARACTSRSRCRRGDRRSRSRDRPSLRAASRRGAPPARRAADGRARPRGRCGSDRDRGSRSRGLESQRLGASGCSGPSRPEGYPRLQPATLRIPPSPASRDRCRASDGRRRLLLSPRLARRASRRATRTRREAARGS